VSAAIAAPEVPAGGHGDAGATTSGDKREGAKGDEADPDAQLAEPVAAASEAGTTVKAEGHKQEQAVEDLDRPGEDGSPGPAVVAAEPDDGAHEVAGEPVTADTEAPADVAVDKTVKATANTKTPADASAETPADAAAETAVEASGRDTSADASAHDAGAESAAAAADPLREVTVVPGVPRYHNTRCILIRFMGENDLEKMTLAAAQNAGCTPCRACLPDQETD
jgi:hypothetical protein